MRERNTLCKQLQLQNEGRTQEVTFGTDAYYYFQVLIGRAMFEWKKRPKKKCCAL